MVSRIEIFLGMLLLFFLWIAFVTQQEIERVKAQKIPLRKSAEIFDAEAREVNATAVINSFKASRAMLVGKIWYLDDFGMSNDRIRSLRSRHAKRTSDTILLEGNVTLLRLDDSIYRADTVIYDRKDKTLRSEGPFIGKKKESYVRGTDFFYDSDARQTRAEKVFAHYLLEERPKEKK
jgi:hypothetical protein